MSKQSGRSHARRFSNSFRTSAGRVVYYQLVAWEWVHEARGIIQPLADEARAAWAVRILVTSYPDRTYETVKRYAPESVTIEQMEGFEAPVVDDLTKLELAHRLGVDWH